MAAKTKAKTEVTYDVEVLYGRVWSAWTVGWTRKGDAMLRARRTYRGGPVACRVVRVERTVVAEVKP